MNIYKETIAKMDLNDLKKNIKLNVSRMKGFNGGAIEVFFLKNRFDICFHWPFLKDK